MFLIIGPAPLIDNILIESTLWVNNRVFADQSSLNWNKGSTVSVLQSRSSGSPSACWDTSWTLRSVGSIFPSEAEEGICESTEKCDDTRVQGMNRLCLLFWTLFTEEYPPAAEEETGTFRHFLHSGEYLFTRMQEMSFMHAVVYPSAEREQLLLLQRNKPSK